MLGCVDIFRYILRQTDKLPLLPTQVQDAKLLHWVPPKERSEFLISEACTPATDAKLCHSDANHCHRALTAEGKPPLPLYSLPKP